MRRNRFYHLFLSAFLFFSTMVMATEPVDYVNPYMGNISHMLVPTFPMVHLPNSMLRMTPQRGIYTESYINGLQVMTPSHRGESVFRISPHSGKKADLHEIMRYAYDNEVVKPYHYQVYLEEEEIRVDFAPSAQSAIYELEFNKTEDAFVVFHSGKGELNYENGALSGYQDMGQKTKVYWYLESDVPVESVGKLSDSNLYFAYAKNTRRVALRYGISFISTEQAKKNLRREIKNFNLKQVADTGREIWNKTLGQITVKGGTEDQKSIFYTSLYRTYERMIAISEDGNYWSGSDKQVHADGGETFFVDDWVWDSYLTHHPLRVLLQPDKQRNILSSYIRMAQQSKEGWMPTFPEVHYDSHRMNGNHAVAVFADALNKGIPFDTQAAYIACKKSIMEETQAPWLRREAGEFDKFYLENGFFPALNIGQSEYMKGITPGERRQSVAVTLESNFDDFCLAILADSLGYKKDKEYFSKRALNYRNLFHPETHFFHPKNADGKFIENIDYKLSGGMGARDYYDENNGWTYRWHVKHNIQDIVRLMDGKEKFEQNLDQLFDEGLGIIKWEFWNTLPDQTGNVGQYSMGNEPSFHIPYLYNYIGKPWKTQKRIRTLLDQWFRNDLMGIPGDEDGGAMSAFVVFSYMGIYPATPGLAEYTIGSPVFDEVTINLPNGKKFQIIAEGSDRQNKYIQRAVLNGKEFNQAWINHSDVAKGGQLYLKMTDKPNREWGTDITKSATYVKAELQN